MIDDSLVGQLEERAARDGVQQLVVGAVIRRADAVLLLRRPAADFMGGIYELPSGKVEPKETVPEALAREVLEETGLQVEQVGDYLGSFDYRSGSGKLSRQLNFEVGTGPEQGVVLSEHDHYCWHSLDEEPPVTDAVKEILSALRS